MTTRKEILDLAAKAVIDRGAQYGSPENNFSRIAAYWRVHIKNRFRVDIAIDGASVALMMDLVKTARLDNDVTHADSWTDKCGYAACGGEIAIRPAMRPVLVDEEAA